MVECSTRDMLQACAGGERGGCMGNKPGCSRWPDYKGRAYDVHSVLQYNCKGSTGALAIVQTTQRVTPAQQPRLQMTQ